MSCYCKYKVANGDWTHLGVKDFPIKDNTCKKKNFRISLIFCLIVNFGVGPKVYRYCCSSSSSEEKVSKYRLRGLKEKNPI